MIRILTDSVATSNYKELHELDVDVISLSVHYDCVSHLDIEMDFDDFNNRLSEFGDNLPKSSQPSIASYENYFEKIAMNGDEFVGIFMSNVLSSSFEGAMMAAKTVKEKFKSFEGRLINTFSACGPQMASILEAVKLRKQCASLNEISQAAKGAVKCSRIMFTPNDLRYLVLGGRLNSVSAKIATKLKIFPIITTIDGKAVVLSKIRTKKKANEQMFKIFANDVKQHGLKYVVIHYAGKKTDELKCFKDKVQNFVKHKVNEVSVSPVISVHSGPAIGIAYECEQEIEGKFSGEIPKIVYCV